MPGTVHYVLDKFDHAAKYKRAPTGGKAVCAERDFELAVLSQLPEPQRDEIEEVTASSLVTDEGLAALSQLKNLRGLRVYGERVTGRFLETLSQAVPKPQLRSLNLAGSSITSTDLQPVANFTDLVSLDLSDTLVDDDGLCALSGLTQLARLDLSYTRVTDQGLSHLKGLTRLSDLNLSHTRVRGAGVAQLCDARLSSLDLSVTKITDSDALGLARAGMNGLLTLNLSRTKVSRVPGLSTALRTLDMSGTRMADDSLIEFIQSSHTASVTRLVLSETNVSDVSTKDLGKLTELRELGLSRTRIGDATLSGLACLRELERLNVSDTEVTDAGVRLALAMPSLRWLDLSDCKVTNACLNQAEGSRAHLTLRAHRTGIATRAAIRGLSSGKAIYLDLGTGVSSGPLRTAEIVGIALCLTLPVLFAIAVSPGATVVTLTTTVDLSVLMVSYLVWLWATNREE